MILITMILVCIMVFFEKNIFDKKYHIGRIKEGKELTVSGKVISIKEKEYSINYIVNTREFGKVLVVCDEKLKEMSGKKISVNSDERLIDNTYKNKNIKNDQAKKICVGNKVKLRGKFTEFKTNTNPGCYNEKKYYYSNKIFIKVKYVNGSIKILDNNKSKVFILRGKIISSIRKISSEKYFGIFVAILTGEKKYADSEILSLYSIVGISHIIAISGLHISFFGLFLYKFLRALINEKSGGIISIILMGVYVFSVDMVSAKRAYIMFVIYILGNMLLRSYDGISALLLAFCILFINNPYMLYGSGCILSFLSVFSLYVIYENIIKFYKIKNPLLKSFVLSLTIQITLRPVFEYTFFQTCRFSVILNLIIVPTMGVLLFLLVLAVFLSFFSLKLGSLICYYSEKILGFYEYISRLFLKIPGSVEITGIPNLYRMYLYYMILFIIILFVIYLNKRDSSEKYKNRCRGCINKESKCVNAFKAECINKCNYYNLLNKKLFNNNLFENNVSNNSFFKNNLSNNNLFNNNVSNNNFFKRKLLKILVSSGLIFLLFFSLRETHKGLSINMIDVGQGDSFLVQDEKINILVDGGSSGNDDIGKYTLLPTLKAGGVKRLDYVIISHFDLDHYNGIETLLSYKIGGKSYVKNLVLADIPKDLIDDEYINLVKICAKNGISVKYISSGDNIKFDKCILKCIWPEKDIESYKSAEIYNKNDFSSVFYIEKNMDEGKVENEFRILFMGDVSSKVEEVLVKEEVLKKVNILKVAHHGSKNSLSPLFFYIVRPDIALISCKKNNIYGHPHKEVLESLEDDGSDIFRTDQNGFVNICVSGKEVRVTPYIK